jgi:hypothetical protein
MAAATQICPRCGRTEAADADFCYCGFVFAKAGQRGSTLPPRAIESEPDIQTERPGWFQQCAQASLAAPLVSGAVSCLTPHRPDFHGTTTIILLIVIWGLPAAGLAGAIVALIGVCKYGAKGLLLPGLVGFLINGAMVALIIYMVVSNS